MQNMGRDISAVMIAAAAAVLAITMAMGASWTGVPASAEGGTLFSVPSPEPAQPEAGGGQEQPAFTVQVVHPEQTVAAKRILIYHTHTYEAYTQVDHAPYRETEKWRTRDGSANVTAVGRALTASLEALGYEVVHDETAFEPPDLSSAYARSLTMLEQRAANGETYDLYIDLHRDAFDDPNAIARTVSISGIPTARFMVLIGKGTGMTGASAQKKPEWEKNLAIAEGITFSMNEQHPQLCRDVCMRSGRFNQHVAPCCILIECGSNHNTLEEVLNGVPYLAQAIDQTLKAQAGE